jgi:hypothetical protein
MVSAALVSMTTTVESAPAAGLGDIFLGKGLITHDQLETALQEQRDRGQELGEFLVARGWITRLDLASVLSEHWQAANLLLSAETERPTAHLRIIPLPDREQNVPETSFDLGEWLAQVETELEVALRHEFAKDDTPNSFVAFAPTATGYRLIECQGTTPAVGDQLTLPDCIDTYLVSRVQRSPLPTDDRICAYLEPTLVRDQEAGNHMLAGAIA